MFPNKPADQSLFVFLEEAGDILTLKFHIGSVRKVALRDADLTEKKKSVQK